MRRQIPLRGSTNFRDLGGYATADGRQLRWGRVFRSDSPARLTDADLADIAKLGLRVVCDLRRDDERADAPSRLAGDLPGEATPEVLHLSAGPRGHSGVLRQMLEDDATTAADLHANMCGLYSAYPIENRDVWAELMARLIAEDVPLLFHCAAGKDRTGFAAALVLSAVAVPRETIFEDYALTNELWRPVLRETGEEIGMPRFTPEVSDVLLRAHPEYLQAAFDSIEREFGDVAAYLRTGLDLDDADLARLRALLLQ